MDEKMIRELLQKVHTGETSVEDACAALRDLPYKDLGFANVDNHRAIRTGFPEVVYCQGKTPEQIRDIMAELVSKGGNIMGTRASFNDYEAVLEKLPEAEFFETSSIIAVRNPEYAERSSHMGTVAVVTAGTADIPVAEEAAVTAELMGNSVSRIYDVGVAGIHRLFNRLDEIRSADVIIVIAGMEGALASVVGGLVDVPVIAVPTSIGYGANMGGLSALLSMLNSCANGVGVVNIDNGFGAAYLASVINRKRK